MPDIFALHNEVARMTLNASFSKNLRISKNGARSLSVALRVVLTTSGPPKVAISCNFY